MFQLSELLNSNFYDLLRKTSSSSLEEKLKDSNLPFEEYLKDDEAISCIKLMGKNTKKYFNSEKVKKLIKLITEEPEEEDHLKGHKFPYIASEILKCDCPFISKRFILNEQEYDEEYPETIEDDNKDDKEIDFDFYKNEFDNDFSKIEEKLENLKKKKDAKNEVNNDNKNSKKNEAEDVKEENNKKEEIENKETAINNESKNKNEEIKDENNVDNLEGDKEIKKENEEINKEKKESDEEKKEDNKNETNNNNNEENKDSNQLHLENNNEVINKEDDDKDINENKEANKEEIKGENKEENNSHEDDSDKIKKDEKEESIKNEKEEKADIGALEEKTINNKEIEEKGNEEKKDNKTENEIDNNGEISDNKKDNEEKENAVEYKENNEKICEEKEEIKEIKEEIKESKEEKVVEEKENKNEEKDSKIVEKDTELEKEDIKEIKDEENEKKEKDEEIQKEEINDDQMLKEEDIDNEQDNNQEEEANEEQENNIIVDNEGMDVDSEEKGEKDIKNENEENKKEDEDSLSIEGEIDDFYSIKKPKPKKKYENKPNNEYLDLLLNFVMNDKPELNYVLSGYFANVMITLINNYPSQILKYLYTQRKDALKKIIKHSNQKAFAILSLKILNLESYIINNNAEGNINIIKNIIEPNINYRNELIKEMIKSVNLEGYIGEDGQVDHNVDIEAKFALVIDIINENKEIASYLINNNEVYTHIFDIIDTELYKNENNTDKNIEDSNFNNKYFIYELFIDLITKLLKTGCSGNIIHYPTEPLVNFIKKEKNEISFNENLIKALGKIINNNFLPKRNLIIEKNSSLAYEGLGMLNIKIIEFIQEMFNFMKEITTQFDNILIRNNFWPKSIDYFFKYQWNNIYHNHFVEFFNTYLLNEEKHKLLTEYLFNNLKFHELLINYLNQEKEKEKSQKQKLKFLFKSGNSTKSGIYPHVIDLIYKIQSIRGLAIFTAEEKINLKIKNYGEFEFSKDEKSNKLIKIINASENINTILKDSKEWNDTTNEIVLPLIKKYEETLCKKEESKKEDSDNESEDDVDPRKIRYKTTSAILNKLLNTIRSGTKQIKRFSLPLSRNDKNIAKPKIDIKSSIRDKLLNKGGFQSQKIFEDDDDEKNKENNNKDDENKNGENNEENKEYNDNNYWEVSNNLPENIKKEVDKKTNIIFNYNPITCENENNDVTEEDEILSVAMGLERKEKMEKSKKLKMALPYKIKPFNLKAKANPVQNYYSSSSDNNNCKNDIYVKNKPEDNEKDEKKENINNGENEENEEEEEGVVKKEEKEEKNEEKGDKNDINEINIEIKDKEGKDEEENIEKENQKDVKDYNDVNYWGISSRMYLNEKEMEEFINDL